MSLVFKVHSKDTKNILAKITKQKQPVAVKKGAAK